MDATNASNVPADGECPVFQKSNDRPRENVDGKKRIRWWDPRQLFSQPDSSFSTSFMARNRTDTVPFTKDRNVRGESDIGCPVRRRSKDGDGTIRNMLISSKQINLPASTEEAARHSQAPLPGQPIPLSTSRVISSIPRCSSPRKNDNVGGHGEVKKDFGNAVNSPSIPSHQPLNCNRWVYPSEQQFYNAMVRKGWTADASTMSTVVAIHNAVNERTFSEIRKWEKVLHDCDNPRLVRFLGRPEDTSPRAWMNANIWGRRAPFDRHDWYVDRGDGRGERRYVIDFYDGNPATTISAGSQKPVQGKEQHRPVSVFLDVRPALDDPQAFIDRAQMAVRETLPGIFGCDEK